MGLCWTGRGVSNATGRGGSGGEMEMVLWPTWQRHCCTPPPLQDDCLPGRGSSSVAVLPVAERAGLSIGAASMAPAPVTIDSTSWSGILKDFIDVFKYM